MGLELVCRLRVMSGWLKGRMRAEKRIVFGLSKKPSKCCDGKGKNDELECNAN
jgi:hypothetical protein